MVDKERLYRTEAVVLKYADFGEADRLLTLYTPLMGKLRAIAKGVRKTTSRKSGHLEPFMRTRLLLARGRDLDIISQAEVVEPYQALRTDLWRLGYASYLCELLDSFAQEEEENEPVYTLLVNALGWISTDTDLDLPTRYYELCLLSYTGYRPQLFRCLQCDHEIRPERNYFSPSEGGLLCPSCGAGRADALPIALNPLKVLRFLQSNDYAACRQVRISAETHREMERILQAYIAYHLEKRLKSTAFLNLLRSSRHLAPVWRS